jgi:hypothetical protein
MKGKGKGKKGLGRMQPGFATKGLDFLHPAGP